MGKVYEVFAPEYQVSQEKVTGHESAGKKLESLREKLFGNKHILVRSFSSEEHGTSLDKAVQEIIETGWDRNKSYDGKGYNKVDCDMFAWKYTPENRLPAWFPLFKNWQGNTSRGNKAFRVDVFVVYDPEKMSCVPYEHNGRLYHDAFKFNDPAAKKDAVLAVIKLTK